MQTTASLNRACVLLGGALILIALVLAVPRAFADNRPTREVLLKTAVPTNISLNQNTVSVEIQNLGPNPIYCSLSPGSGALLPDGGAITDGGAVVATKARKIDVCSSSAGCTWAFDRRSPGMTPSCIAGTADQSTGAATIVNEI